MSRAERLRKRARHESGPAAGIVGVVVAAVMVGKVMAGCVLETWNISMWRRISRLPLLPLSCRHAPSMRKLTGGHGCSRMMPNSAPDMLCPSAPWGASEDQSLGGSNGWPVPISVVSLYAAVLLPTGTLSSDV